MGLKFKNYKLFMLKHYGDLASKSAFAYQFGFQRSFRRGWEKCKHPVGTRFLASGKTVDDVSFSLINLGKVRRLFEVLRVDKVVVKF